MHRGSPLLSDAALGQCCRLQAAAASLKRLGSWRSFFEDGVRLRRHLAVRTEEGEARAAQEGELVADQRLAEQQPEALGRARGPI